MIYDCFIFSGEKDCLDIRMEELKSLDVRHVLVQSFRTFSGKEKKCTWFYPELNKDLVVDTLWDLPDGTPWEREEFQRNAILNSLIGAKDDDIVIISDADEIPRREAVEQYKPEMGITALIMDLYYYYVNCLYAKQVWSMPKILTYGMLKNSTPDLIRKEGYRSMIQNGGWHFSYLGGVGAIQEKIQSFSHTEFNTAQFNNETYITEKIKNFEYLWGDKKLTTVEIDNSYPNVIFNNQSQYSHLIRKL